MSEQMLNATSQKYAAQVRETYPDIPERVHTSSPMLP